MAAATDHHRTGAADWLEGDQIFVLFEEEDVKHVAEDDKDV